MKVKMLTVECGPQGNFQPGDIREVSNEQGRQLIAGGFAVAATPRELGALPRREAAMMPPAMPRKRGG